MSGLPLKADFHRHRFGVRYGSKADIPACDVVSFHNRGAHDRLGQRSMAIGIGRRELIIAVGSTAIGWPLAARAQQTTNPVIGFLSNASSGFYAIRLSAFHQGLKEDGFIKDQNVTIEYRWAEGLNDRLPTLATELVRRPVDIIVAAGGTPAAEAAKAATKTIPIVFAISVDPVEIGLVASLTRPGGNLTGISNLNVAIGPKRLELLHELLPKATVIALMVNPTNPVLADHFLRALEPAASAVGLKLQILQVSADHSTLLCILVPTAGGRACDYARCVLQ